MTEIARAPHSTLPDPVRATPLRWRIGVIDADRAEDVSALRRAAYRQAAEFEWNDESTLDWSEADDRGTVLAVCDRYGMLLSTLRATVFDDIAAAETFLEYSLQGLDVPMPTLVMSRAATHPDHARHGLLALLRQAYTAVLPATPLRSVSAIVYEGAPRLRSMHEAGYVFKHPAWSWDSEAVARTRPMLAMLPRSRFPQARRVATAAVATRLAEVEVDTAGMAAALARQIAAA